ncbi:hypothetical protein FQN51_002064 [Onygenales sp. PD_10]|nr:hypothetical protein FQN51_002064 [Onygenales sp. PD_10]
MAFSLLQIPSFPSFTGPHKVGTSEFEIPVSSLDSPAATPQSDIPLSTILFRVFYPAEEGNHASKPVYWIPEPQGAFSGALAEFLGLPKRLSNLLAILPNTLKWVKIPAYRDVPLKTSTLPSKRWPVMVFSHGIGGSRNMYSYLLGCLASYGIVVIAPEHRDGSSPVSFVRGLQGGQSQEKVPYQEIKHVFDPKILHKRHAQLRIRLWELGLVHDALLKLDAGKQLSNLIETGVGGPVFTSSLDIHSPSSIVWAGHSFGAASMVQFVKSIYWGHVSQSEPAMTSEPSFSQYKPLYQPDWNNKLVSQVTPASPLILLDLWNLPLLGDDMKWLWEKPLPCYASKDKHPTNVLAILSDEFFKWAAGLKATRFALSNRAVPGSPNQTMSETQPIGPRVFYATKSAHLSQSDAGMLFPWVMKRFRQAEEPERTMQLNVTAIIQMLRESGVPFDLDEETQHALENVADVSTETAENENAKPGHFSPSIFATDGSVRGWLPISLIDDSKPVPEFEVRTALKL